MPKQPTPYTGYISLVPPANQHPPALSNISNVAASRDPDPSPPKKKNATVAPTSSDALVAATLAYADASDPNSGDDVWNGDCNVSAEQRMAVEAVESSFASASADESKSDIVESVKSAAVDDPDSKPKTNKVWFEGHQFTFHKPLKNGTRHRCMCQQSEEDCNAVLKVINNGNMILTGSHATGCARRNGQHVVAQAPSDAMNGNYITHSMHQWIEERATDPDHLHDPPSVICCDCIAHFTEHVGNNFYGLDKNQMHKLVYHSRDHIFGSNAIATVILTNFFAIVQSFLTKIKCTR
jgi:hypothetical protein